jgi:2,4-dienoyl-CoA reductase-like NADH-dependent reductase (Old Yellow Enzyme family)
MTQVKQSTVSNEKAIGTQNLFSPFTIRGITLPNRIAVSPMCQYSATDGKPSDWHLVHLGSRAVGGAGLVIAEASGVEARGRITPGCAGIWSDEHIEPWQRITKFIKENGSVPGIQIAHAGRKASCALPWNGGASLSDEQGGWGTIGPSPIAFGGDLTKVPREMTVKDIEIVRQSFVDAAKRAVAAGFEWVEFHSAHGYLSHSFYSPISNQRQDQYGGSFDNRVRFTLETASAIRQALPETIPLSVRISSTDWVEDGWTLNDSIELSRRLKNVGADLIDCSSGGNVLDAKIPTGAGYQTSFAAAIRREAGIATGAVGMITEPAQADQIIRNGVADIVLLAREFLRNPYFAHDAAKALRQTDKAHWPVQYGRA